VARALLARVNAGIAVANRVPAGGCIDDQDEAHRISALLLDQAAANAAVILADQHAARVRARGARSVHALFAMVHASCIALRPRSTIQDEAEIAQFMAALPCPPWSVWQQVPTAMCCSADCWMVLPRQVVLVLTALLLYAPGPRGMALRAAGGSTAVAVVLLLHFLVLDPTFTAFATYARYGTLVLRQPGRSLLRTATFTVASHGLVENTLPLPLYAAIMVARAGLPLLAHGAQALQLEPLGRVRLLNTHAALDVLHAVFCCLCFLHAAHVARARRRLRVKVAKQL
jgi:hypothetical protein